jgi:site-specific DNA-methyltransferase (adenine-specific)
MRYKFRSLHGSQKPLNLVEIAITTSTEQGDAVWEPFGGLCPAAIAAIATGRKSMSAEIVPEFYLAAKHRLESAACQHPLPR